MADRDTDILLIGGGVASANAAAVLREEGFDGSILLVGRELDPPYHRPPASKGYLQGRESKADALVHPGGWWEQQRVELKTRTSVMALDPNERTATLQSKETVAFGQALVAPGAMGPPPQADGPPPPGRGRRARRHPLPSRPGQRRHVAPRRRGRTARRLRRRLVHRLGG